MGETRFVLDTNAVIFITTKGNIVSYNLEQELNFESPTNERHQE